MAQLAWTPDAWDEYTEWQTTDRRKTERINRLIKSTLRTPYSGEGKPEPLRFQLAGYWSRRIDEEHRLVYKWEEQSDTLTIVRCRYHYRNHRQAI